ISASYCFVLHGRCIAPRVRDSIFAEHQRPQVAAFMECVDFMQPRWPSRISTFNSIFCRSFRFGTRESVGGISYETLAPENIVTRGVRHWEIADPAKNAEEVYATHERLERLRHATQRMMHAGAIQSNCRQRMCCKGASSDKS